MAIGNPIPLAGARHSDVHFLPPETTQGQKNMWLTGRRLRRRRVRSKGQAIQVFSLCLRGKWNQFARFAQVFSV